MMSHPVFMAGVGVSDDWRWAPAGAGGSVWTAVSEVLHLISTNQSLNPE